MQNLSGNSFLKSVLKNNHQNKRYNCYSDSRCIKISDILAMEDTHKGGNVLLMFWMNRTPANMFYDIDGNNNALGSCNNLLVSCIMESLKWKLRTETTPMFYLPFEYTET